MFSMIGSAGGHAGRGAHAWGHECSPARAPTV